MQKLLKPAIRISIAVAVLLTILIPTYSYWYPRATGLYIMWLIRDIDIPAIKIVPKEFSDDAQTGKVSFIFQDIAFTTPWPIIDERKEGTGYLALLSNDNQNNVVIFESVPIYENTF